MIENFFTSTDNTDSVEETTETQPTHAPFTPFNDLIQVKRVVVDNSKIGSILIAEKYREISNRGTVIGVGHKVEGITAGDIVLFGLHDSETLTLRDEEFLLVRVGDVRGVERAL